jgi:hypothetical protein
MNKLIIELINGLSIIIFIIYAWIFGNKPNQGGFKPVTFCCAIIFLVTAWLNFILYNEFNLRVKFIGHEAFLWLIMITIFVVILITYLIKR